jgi:hypothetical protein
MHSLVVVMYFTLIVAPSGSHKSTLLVQPVLLAEHSSEEYEQIIYAAADKTFRLIGPYNKEELYHKVLVQILRKQDKREGRDVQTCLGRRLCDLQSY